MQRPNGETHSEQTQNENGKPDVQDFIHDMKTAPNDESSDAPKDGAENKDYSPSPSEIMGIVLDWAQHYWDAPREKSKWTEIATLILTLLIAVAAVWSAWVFQGQLNEARTATNLASESFRIDERAWVEIEPIKPEIVAARVPHFGALFKYKIYPKNVGKTAARDIAVKAEDMGATVDLGTHADWVRNIQDKELLNKFTESGTGKPVIVPRNPVPKILAPGTTTTVPFILAGQEPQVFPKEEVVSYLIGRIDYTDVFGVQHWLKFCFFVANPSGELRNCQEGNDEDRNPEMPPDRKPN